MVVSSAFLGWWLSEPGAPASQASASATRSPPVVASIRTEDEPDEDLESEDESEPGRIAIRARRLGSHLVVDAALSGPSGGHTTVEMLVDTGATVLVLPASLIDELGFDPADLQTGRAQTARGVVRTRNGILDRVEIGGDGPRAALEDVEVAFVGDRYLGGKALLGMSFLGRYQLLIDDRRDEITLIELDE